MRTEAEILKCDVRGMSVDARAGETIDLIVEIRREHTGPDEVQLMELKSEDGNVLLDIDMFQHGLVLRRGESYRFQMPIIVREPQPLDLSRILLRCESERKEISQALGVDRYEVNPSLAESLEVNAIPLCQYEEGPKVLVTIKNRGVLDLHDVNVDVPADQVAAGKTQSKWSVLPATQEHRIELVLASESLTIDIVAKIDAKRCNWKEQFRIDAIQPKRPKWYRFIEPKLQSHDQPRIFRVRGGVPAEAACKNYSVFLLQADAQYEVRIQPVQGARDVVVRSIQSMVDVRKMDRDRDVWIATIDVAAPGFFRKQDRLYYDVATSKGVIKGDIPICVIRPPLRYGSQALQWGALSLLGGVVGIWTGLKAFGFSPAAFEPMDLVRIGAIPAIWLLYWGADWLQYRMFR